MKTCTKCKKPLPLEMFHKQSKARDGHRTICKSCRAQKLAKKAKDPRFRESERQRMKKYRESEMGKKKRLDYQKQYREQGPGRKIQAVYDKSPHGREKNRKNAALYRKRNPEKCAAHQAVNRAVRKGKLTRARKLLCSKCGKPADSYHHFSYDPKHWLDVQPLCYSCHQKTHI